MAELLADGVYLDLALSAYLADPAIGGHGLKTLLVDPPGWRWERPDNPLWERAESRALTRGSAAHCAILEGLAEFEARYCVAPKAPAGALRTADDLREWLRAAGLKVGGSKAELRARILDACYADDAETAGRELPEFWDDEARDELLAGRTAISEADDAYVRLLERFVRADPALGPLVQSGLAEVSVIWTEGAGEGAVRCKARFDYVGPHGVVDLKTFGQPPRIGRTLAQHLVADICGYGYDLQALHQMQGWRAASRFLLGERGELSAAGPGARDRLDRLQVLAEVLSPSPPYHWLFLRMGGAPTGIALPFERNGDLWRRAETHRAQALSHFRTFRAAYGEGELWFRSEGVAAIEDTDIPPWAWEIAA